MKPRVPITDKEFRYRNSASTDVRKTWAEARKRMREQEQPQLDNLIPITPHVWKKEASK